MNIILGKKVRVNNKPGTYTVVGAEEGRFIRHYNDIPYGMKPSFSVKLRCETCDAIHTEWDINLKEIADETD